MADWHVEQNIVCIEDIAHDPRRRPDRFPAKGAVYTIRGIRPNPDADAGSPVGFLLAEIVDPHQAFSDGQGENHFGCDAFRPIKRADLSGLRALLVGEFARSELSAKLAGTVTSATGMCDVLRTKPSSPASAASGGAGESTRKIA